MGAVESVVSGDSVIATVVDKVSKWQKVFSFIALLFGACMSVVLKKKQKDKDKDKDKAEKTSVPAASGAASASSSSPVSVAIAAVAGTSVPTLTPPLTRAKSSAKSSVLARDLGLAVKAVESFAEQCDIPDHLVSEYTS